MQSPRTHQRDEGAALVMALIAIVVFAVIASAVAGFAFTSYKRTASVNNKIDKVTAAESGVRHVFDQITKYSGSCPPSALLYQPTINDLDVDVTCTYDGAGPIGGTNWALVLLNDPSLYTFLANGGSKTVSGPVYLEHVPQDLGLAAVQKLIVKNGFVVASTCDPPGADPYPWLQFELPDGSLVGADEPGFLQCGGYSYPKTYDDYVAQGLVYPLPPDLTGLTEFGSVTPPQNLSQDPSNTTCRVYEPGIYRGVELPAGSGSWDLRAGADGNSPSAGPEEVWFKPGIYYFEDTILNIDKANVKAGVPSGEIKIADKNGAKSMPSCIDTSPAPDVGGAVFILGGTSRIDINGPDSRLEIFAGGVSTSPLSGVTVLSIPEQGAPPDYTDDLWPGTDGPGTYGVKAVDSALINDQSDCGPSAPYPILRSDNGQNPAFGTDGKLVVPDQKICLKTTGQDAAFQVSGGVIASAIAIEVASGAGLIIGATGGEFPFRVVVQSTARGGGNLGPDVTATAVAEVISYDTTNTGNVVTEIAVASWRVA